MQKTNNKIITRMQGFMHAIWDMQALDSTDSHMTFTLCMQPASRIPIACVPHANLQNQPIKRFGWYALAKRDTSTSNARLSDVNFYDTL